MVVPDRLCPVAMELRMADIKLVAKQVKSKGRASVLEKIHRELSVWLAELKWPKYSGASSWEEVVIEYKVTPEEIDAKSGITVRFALRLYTAENQYLISLMESLGPLDEGNFVLTVHVNWQSDELRKRKALEETYGSHFDEMLKAKHTLWAQSFREGKLADALNAGVVAILGHELKAEPPQEKIGELIQPVTCQVPSFPKPSDD